MPSVSQIPPSKTPSNLNNSRNTVLHGPPDSCRAGATCPAAAGPEKHLLGIIAESSSHAEKTDDPNPADELIKRRYRRLGRAAALLPDTRLAQCSWREAPQAAYVVGRYDPDHQRSYFANLIQCDKPSCPVCGYRRAEQARHELSVALAQAEKGVFTKPVSRSLRRSSRALGAPGWVRRRRSYYFPLLITGTLRHHADDDLAGLKAALANAWDKTFSGRWYADLCAEYLIAGKTKSWENLFGRNGFHPHLHGLMFMAYELVGHSLDQFTDRLRQRWIDQLSKQGFDASWANGLDVRTAKSDIADYIAKFGREPLARTWGADAEVAMSPVKKSHFEGLTPFELLDAADGDKTALERLSVVLVGLDRDRLIERAGWLFREQYRAFERTAQIHWGKSLRAVLRIDEALAEFEQANPVEHNDEDMVLIERGPEWKKVLTLPDGRAELRAVIRSGDAFKVLAWLGLHGIAGIVSESALERSSARPSGSAAPERSIVTSQGVPFVTIDEQKESQRDRPPAAPALVQSDLFAPGEVRTKHVYE